MEVDTRQGRRGLGNKREQKRKMIHAHHQDKEKKHQLCKPYFFHLQKPMCVIIGKGHCRKRKIGKAIVGSESVGTRSQQKPPGHYYRNVSGKNGFCRCMGQKLDAGQQEEQSRKARCHP